MDTHSGHHAHLCDGSLHNRKGGSWIGHFLPGIVLSIWGLHWFVSTCYSYLAPRLSSTTASHRNDNRKSAAATHRVLFAPRELHLEAWLKVILPAVAICLEFSLSGTRRLRCPPGSVKAGELDVEHMNSWSHATNYPPLILSGFIDLLHARHPLPHGIPHAFLSLAFGINAFLMLTHSKPDALDALVHKLLGYCMTGVCATVGADGIWSGSFVTGAAKSLALMMQGLWFFAVTHIEFSADVMWTAGHAEDMTRVMFTPILFSWIILGLLCFMLVIYISMQTLLSRSTSPRHHGKAETQGANSNAGAGKYLQLPVVSSITGHALPNQHWSLQEVADNSVDILQGTRTSLDHWDGADARAYV